MKHTILGQFLRNPFTTGAICPSSRDLACAMTAGIGIDHAKVVVELGSGTGAITGSIITRIAPSTSFFAVELNTAVSETFRERFPEVKLYNDSASNIASLLAMEGQKQADIILSGLPWASFSDGLQEELLTAILEVLPKDGCFCTFAYLQGALLPTGINFRRRLKRYFNRVEKSRIVWKNIPPAFVYRCYK